MKKYAKATTLAIIFGLALSAGPAMAGKGKMKGPGDGICDLPLTTPGIELDIVAGKGKGGGDRLRDGSCLDGDFAPTTKMITAGNGYGKGKKNGGGNGTGTGDRKKDGSCLL